MMYNCETFKNIDGTISSILLFGLAHPVKPYTEQAAKNAVNSGLEYHCNAIDKAGNIYTLFADYDPCLAITKTIAFKMENVIKITVELFNNGKTISYTVNYRYGETKVFDEKTIPKYLIELMNKNSVIYHLKDNAENREVFCYAFN